MPKIKNRRSKEHSSASKKEVFYVEKIIDKKIGRSGRVEYLLKWKNYPESESTWEPENNLDCAQLIEDYEMEHNVEEKSMTVSLPYPTLMEENGGESKEISQSTLKVVGYCCVVE